MTFLSQCNAHTKIGLHSEILWGKQAAIVRRYPAFFAPLCAVFSCFCLSPSPTRGSILTQGLNSDTLSLSLTTELITQVIRPDFPAWEHYRGFVFN